MSNKSKSSLILAIIICVLILVVFFGSRSFGATYFIFNYASNDGTGGRFIVRSETNGDSITGGTLTETERGILTYWKGSANLDIGSYVIEGIIAEGLDTSTGAYRIDISPKANYDSILIVLDSLESQDGWVAHQSTSDSLYDELQKIIDSLQASLDSIQNQDNWIAQQSEVANLDGWMPITDNDSLIVDMSSLSERPAIGDTNQTEQIWNTTQRDSILAALTNAAIYYKVWLDAAVRELTALGFDLDSADFTNKSFPTWLFTTEYFDSAQGSASSLTALDIWNIAFGSSFDAGSMGDSLSNAAYVQGSASGLSAEEIADTLHNRDSLIFDEGYWHKIANRSDSGTQYGQGTYTLRIYTIDTSGSDDTLATVPIQLQNETGGRHKKVTTNSGGYIDFGIDSGTWLGVIDWGPAWNFPDTSWLVNANDTVAFYGYNVDIPSPSNPSLSSVYGNIYEITGVYDSGIIVIATRLTSNAVDTVSGIIISVRPAIDTTNNVGNFSFDLIRTGQFTDTTKGFYHIEAKYKNWIIFDLDSLYIPATGNVDVSKSIAN